MQADLTAMKRLEIDNFILSLRDGQNQTFGEIASRIGLSRKSVQVRYYKRVNADQEKISRASALHGQGIAPEAIARELGVHVVTVSRWTGSRLNRGQSGRLEVQRWILEIVNSDGASIASAARQLGMSRSLGWNCYQRAAGPGSYRPSRMNGSELKTAAIVELRERYHLSWRAIASRMNMSSTGVRRRYYANSDSSRPATPSAASRVNSRPDYRENLVVQLRDAGMSFAAVATQIGGTASSVRSLYYCATDADVERMRRALQLSETGLSVYEIANQLRVHELTVARWTGGRRAGRPSQAALNRIIVQLRDKDRLGFNAISRHLGISPPNVRRRYRAEVDKQEYRIAETRALYEEGTPLAEIAQNVGAHEETIRRWTASRPVRGRPRRLDVSDEAIRCMRDDQGLTFRAIGERTGLSEASAWRRYKRITMAVLASAAVDAARWRPGQ
jgi:transposase